MPKKWIQIALVVFCTVFLPYMSQAQGADDVLRYSLQYPSFDPVSVVVPGVSQATGFGAYQENPASMALFNEGFMSFGLSSRAVSEQGRYLGNTTDFDDSQASVGDLGFVYKVPTVRGSLVVGGGYSQTTDFNRAFAAGGRNNESTITDFYNNTTIDDSLFFAAFDAFAIDYAGPDSSYANTTSIFRVGFSDYPGIRQDIELTERGAIGEYSAFFATEVQKGLMVGASLGLLAGSYSYERLFLETDTEDEYNVQFFNDVDNILSEDIINADLAAFSARLGFVYQPVSAFSIGGSYQFKSKLSVDETFNTLITTTFDDGEEIFEQAPGRFSYHVVRPDRLNLGITLRNIAGFAFSVAGERVRYSQGRIDFEDIQLRDSENEINQTVESSLRDVINVRAGVEFEASPMFVPRVGYSYFPSPQRGFDTSREFISGGFSARLFENLSFDLGIQYATWQDRNTLYSYNYSYDDGMFITDLSGQETAREEVSRWNVMAGIKIGL